ncbi:MAG: AI-2E family transporter, partial [Bdellovibrionales bacterium]|nr:AI-2E family transporter [Bdellovibrionales bacterium]
IKNILLPILVGALLAYICKPLMNSFKYRFLPNSLRFTILGLALCLSLTGFCMQVKKSLPNRQEQLSLYIRLQYKINGKLAPFLNSNHKSMVSKMLVQEISPAVNALNQLLSLDEVEQAEFETFLQKDELSSLEKKVATSYAYNKEHYYSLPREPSSESSLEILMGPGHFKLKSLYSSISSWFLMPLIFLFLLFDKGRIRRYAIGLVPNRFFELSLTLIHRVDIAIGNYLRGTFLQSSLVGFSMFVPFILIGIPWKAAVLISIASAAANAIPFLGPIIGLVIGLTYGLIAEEVNPLIPYMTPEHVFAGVMASVGFAKLLDDLYFQPVVLGNAVDLHPIVVILALVVGASLYGVVGMLLAVPLIVVSKVLIETLTDQLKAYKII